MGFAEISASFNQISRPPLSLQPNVIGASPGRVLIVRVRDGTVDVRTGPWIVPEVSTGFLAESVCEFASGISLPAITTIPLLRTHKCPIAPWIIEVNKPRTSIYIITLDEYLIYIAP